MNQQPGHRAYIEAANLRAGLEHEADPRELIRDYLVQRVEHGVVRSRADVVSVRELYDRARTAVDGGALEKLSGQFETEQRRHSGQVEALQRRFEQQTAQNETLRRRIEQLSGQLRCLDADYRTLAETLRGPWN